MGLDITAYQNITLVPSGDPDEDRTINVNKDFAERADDLTDGAAFVHENSYRFHAGSYGGYNRWRDNLARFAGYGSADEAWKQASGPFWELINFSDCEGTIGPKTSAKLLKDFQEFAGRAHDFEPGTNDHSYGFFTLYKEWMRTFELAAQNGFVDFH